MSKTPARNSTHLARRVSLPFSTKPAETPYRSNVGLLRNMESPDISVNAPRIDKMAEFTLASSENPVFRTCKTSTSAQCFTSIPGLGSADCSITKDKCTVEVVERASSKPRLTDGNQGVRRNSSESSENCPTIGLSNRSSLESRQRRFDTSSYQQRAEALEGLLEFSALLLRKERFQELGMLLKPFGSEKASPRETAIWLTKSFKETAI